jgi:hypothetical protein
MPSDMTLHIQLAFIDIQWRILQREHEEGAFVRNGTKIFMWSPTVFSPWILQIFGVEKNIFFWYQFRQAQTI